MGMVAGNKKGLRSDINVTPYIDILLVLLIIFMVVTPIKQRELRVKAPQPPSPVIPAVEPPSGAIVLSVAEDARIEINRIPVDLSSLGSKLREIFSERPNKNMFISASPRLPYGDVVRVIDISKGAGVADIGLLSEEIR